MSSSSELLLGPNETQTGHRGPDPTSFGLTGAPAGPAAWPTIPGYRIEAELGRGGMGVVYRAVQLALNRPVALKLILDSALATQEQKLRFQFEAELAARVRHPNVVQVHEVGLHDGHPFIAYEFIEGGSLQQALRGRPVAPRLAAALVAQLADGVQAAHSQGIIHRDLKPANILLSQSGGEVVRWRGGDQNPDHHLATAPPHNLIPKIADFGLAKQYEEASNLTGTGTAVGTPHYMAPEQARGDRRIGPAADLYALGAILYELVSGRTPHVGENAIDVLLQAQMTDPPALASLVPQAPKDLDAICGKCLAAEPERRYATAADLAADLRRHLEGRPIRARRAGRLERLRLWRRRNPLVAVLAASLFLALLSGLAVSSAFALRSERLRKQAEGDAKRADDLRVAADQHRKQALAEAKRAEAEAARAKQAIDSMTTDQAFLSMGRMRLAWTADQIAFLNSAMAYYRELADRPAVTPAERLAAADARRRLGFLLHRLYRLADAVPVQAQAVASLRALHSEFPAEPQHREILATALSSQGMLLHHAGDLRGALAAYLEAIELRREPLKARSLPFRLAVAHCDDLARAARLQAEFGEPAAAEQLRQEALLLAEALAAADPNAERPAVLLVMVLGDLAFARSMRNTAAEADAFFARGRPLAEALLGQEQVGPERLEELGRFYEQLTSHSIAGNDVAATEPLSRRSLEIAERLASLAPGLMAPAFNLASALEMMGRVKMRQGQPAEARRFFERGLAIIERTPAGGEDRTECAFRRLELRRHLAKTHEAQGDREEAERVVRAAFEEFAAAQGEKMAHGRHRPYLAMAYTDLAFLLRARGKTAEGRPALSQALALCRRLALEDPASPRAARDLGGALCNLAVFDRELGRLRDAEEEAKEAAETLLAGLKLAPKDGTLRRFLANAHINLARVRESQGRFDDAAVELGKAAAQAEEGHRFSLLANQALALTRAEAFEAAAGLARQALAGQMDRQAMGCCALVFAAAARAEPDEATRGQFEALSLSCLRSVLRSGGDATLFTDPTLRQALDGTPAFRDLLWLAAEGAEG